mmetsp:Transcript_28977/g.38622  ORF Transcript_28977/g.38622 Transcript_28977/m.38622 type:complete len:201 (-) Transcript_28977:74-676(-)
MFLPHFRKLRKAKRDNASQLEKDVAKALYDLELQHKTLRNHLPRFHINTAKEVEARGTKKGLVVFYPLRYLMLVRKVQKVLTAELEKRFAGRVVQLVAQRKVTKRPTDVYKRQAVRRSMTRVAVDEGVLNDLLAPADVVAKRWRFRSDGSKVMKVYLDTRDKKKIEPRLPVVTAVFKKLVHRNISFGFMWNPKLQQVAHK